MKRYPRMSGAAGLSVLVLVSCGGDEASEPAAFAIETTTLPGARPVFTATGSAIDEGLLCGAGTAQPRQTLCADTGLPESADDPPQDGDVLWVTFDFTCDDGSGTFALRTEATVDTAGLQTVIEDGELSSSAPFSLLEGTGAYEDVEMSGVRQFTVVTAGGFDDGVIDIFTGTLDET